MNLKQKVWIVLAISLLLMAMTPTALAASEEVPDGDSEEGSSFWEDVKGAGAEVWQSAKEHAPGWWQSIKDVTSSAVDTVKEHGPGWVETAQEKGSELLGKGADALQSAGEQVSGFLEDQQNQFWERTEQQIYGGSGSSPATGSAPESSVPGSSTPDASASTASSAPDEAGSVPDGATTDDAAVGASAPPASAPDATADAASDTVSDAGGEADPAAPEQNAGPDNSQSHRLVADEDTTNAEGAGEAETTDTAESTEAAPKPDMTFVWVAMSLGLVAVACGSLYLLRNQKR